MLTEAKWQAQQKLKSWRCFNCGIQGHFVQDYRKPMEEALLTNSDEEVMLL
jgi:hypothetical protein